MRRKTQNFVRKMKYLLKARYGKWAGGGGAEDDEEKRDMMKTCGRRSNVWRGDAVGDEGM